MRVCVVYFRVTCMIVRMRKKDRKCTLQCDEGRGFGSREQEGRMKQS